MSNLNLAALYNGWTSMNKYIQFVYICSYDTSLQLLTGTTRDAAPIPIPLTNRPENNNGL